MKDSALLGLECLPLGSAIEDSRGGVQSVVSGRFDTSFATDQEVTFFRRLDISPSSGGTRKM